MTFFQNKQPIRLRSRSSLSDEVVRPQSRTAGQAGFTMPQLIITISIILILSVAVVALLKPAARIGEAKNNKRTQDINLIAVALAEYVGEHKGVLPILGSVTTDKKVLCSSQSGSNLSCSGDSQICLTIDDDDFYKYLGKLPYDPDKDSNSDSGYYLQKDANDNLIVGSCASYNSEEIIKRPKVRINCLVYAGGYCWHLSENDNTTCNAVCSGFNLDCINGATYGPDLDSEDNAYCALQKHINSGYCPLVCSELGAIGSPPIISISLTCQIQNGPLDCNHSSDHNEFPVCPCQ